jgi:ABC-2 type transport system ATP-binding protein
VTPTSSTDRQSAVPPAIELRAVTVRDGSRLLLDSVDLTVEAGQSWAVVGSNGSGKSALLRVIAGLCRPSAGRVWVGGWNVLERPDRTRRLIGYAADEPGLADRMTALEHLEMVGAQRGLGRADRRAAAESMLQLVDLTSSRESYVGALSRGQRRRLSLALALVHDPPVVLLDDPLAGVDELGRGELVSVLLELRSMGKSLLIASQSPTDVADVCDAVASLAGGRLATTLRHTTTMLTWIEILGAAEPALRALSEHPGVDDLRHDGSFVTFHGAETPEQRAAIAEWLLARDVHLAGFGATATPAGGDAG